MTPLHADDFEIAIREHETAGRRTWTWELRHIGTRRVLRTGHTDMSQPAAERASLSALSAIGAQRRPMAYPMRTTPSPRELALR